MPPPCQQSKNVARRIEASETSGPAGCSGADGSGRRRNGRYAKGVEARGVEPLSSKLSTQASTCVAGEIFREPNFAPAHCQPPSIHEILSPPGAVAPPDN